MSYDGYDCDADDDKDNQCIAMDDKDLISRLVP